ncbi:MAG: YceI family protein [Cyclobacteriaceae bacterium]|nr:YceI family protein [Cyclobacteriaceae bacterium]
MNIKKRFLFVSGLFVALLLFFYACKTKTETINSESTAAALDGTGDVYLVDTLTSIIEWIGATPSNYQHNGTIQLSAGQFTISNNQLTSGEFTININSITNLDQTGKDKTNLEGHLKNEDFFEVEKFPFGSFKITAIRSDSTGEKIVGNLTLKEKTNVIEIPVKLKIDEKFVLAETPTFTIDRTKWGIVYNSGIIGTIKDDLINDEISLKLKIVAVK